MDQRKRRKKFEREPAALPRFQLQPRDLELVRTVSDYRFADTQQLLALHPGGSDNVGTRLKLLFHAGYLDRPRDQAAWFRDRRHMIYALGDKGAELLAEKFSDRGEAVLEGREAWLARQSGWRKKNYEVGAVYLWHTLMIGDFRATLTLALQEHPAAKLLFWKQGEDLKDHVKVGGFRTPVVPDAFFSIKRQDGTEAFFFLEADRSTMTLDRFRRKIEAYREWHRQKGYERKYHIPGFRVLTATISGQRRDNLTAEVARLFPDKEKKGALAYLFACEKDYDLLDPKTILGNIWMSPKNTTHSVLL